MKLMTLLFEIPENIYNNIKYGNRDKECIDSVLDTLEISPVIKGKSERGNVIKTLDAMITCTKKKAEGYPECFKDCDDCSLLYEQGNSEERIEALETAKSALIALEQFKWERDIAIKQLNDLGYGFGQKIEPQESEDKEQK